MQAYAGYQWNKYVQEDMKLLPYKILSFSPEEHNFANRLAGLRSSEKLATIAFINKERNLKH